MQAVRNYLRHGGSNEVVEPEGRSKQGRDLIANRDKSRVGVVDLPELRDGQNSVHLQVIIRERSHQIKERCY